MAENLRVFISSSMSELSSERKLVAKTLRDLGIASFVYEHDAGARPMGIEATYVSELKQCDMYVGIFWKKYGEYTLDEYNKAKDFNRPRLIYQKELEASARDPRLQDFLNEIGEVKHGDVAPCFFHDAEELPERITEDVMRVLTDAFRTGSSSTAQNPDEMIEPTQLPCLCDRAPQERHLRKGVLDYKDNKSGRPVLLLLGGQRQDGHRFYVTRLELRSLLESLTLIGRNGKRKVVILPDPLSDTSSVQALSDDLGMMLASKLRVAFSPNHQFVMDYLKREHITTLIVTLTITSRDYRSGLRNPLTRLYELLTSYVELPDGMLIGFFVSIQLDGDDQTWREDLSNCLALHAQLNKAHLIQLPPLAMITPEDVSSWLGLSEVQRHLPFIGQSDVDGLFSSTQELPMEELFGKLQGVITKARHP